MIKTSTLYLLVTLLAISLLTFVLMSGCDEQQIKSPVIGPSAGSGPVGGGDAQKIRLTANPSETITALADAQATVQITAIVENNIGQPMPDGTVVYWTATNGTLDSVTTTTTNGASTVTLTFTKDFTGSSVVTAIAGDATGSITINVVSVTPTATITPTTTPTTTPTPSKAFIVSAENTSISHGGTTNINATVLTNGQPDQNIQVTFTVSGGGGVLSANAATTNASGVATVVFTGNNTSASDITATITASTFDGRTGSTTVIVGSGATPTPTATPVTAITSMTIPTLGSPPYVMTDGDSENIQVTVTRGGFAADGTVTFSLSCSRTSGNPTESFISSTTANLSGGIATTTFNAVNNSSPNEPEYCTATATTDGASSSITITVNP